MLKLLYFAQLRERFGAAGENFRLSDRVHDVRALIAVLRERGGAWDEMLADEARVRIAVNCAMANRETVLAEGDEVALFPPVTGG